MYNFITDDIFTLTTDAREVRQLCACVKIYSMILLCNKW